MKDVLNYLEDHSERFLDELKEFLRIPSISTDAERGDDVRQAAEWVCSQLEEIGMERAEVYATDGHPIVYAERIEREDLPTVLVYGHYDVQPVDPLELWESNPFEPTIRGSEIYGRGTTDDKGQMLIHFKGAEAFLRERGKLPVNLKFLIEGEEEIGSVHLDSFVDEHLEMLTTDVVMISDTAMFSAEVPSVCYGLRGIAYMEIEAQGPRGDLHSGSYGGPVGNPALILAEILASLRDEEGRVTIPGFYDDVIPLTRREREEWASLPFDEQAFKEELGVDALDGEAGFTPLEQLWSRPTLDVNGLLSGFVGEGAKTVLPAKAMAKVSMRLVPNQDFKRIEKLFREHVLSIAPPFREVDSEKSARGEALGGVLKPSCSRHCGECNRKRLW